jgi:MOB kinase activator 1
VPSLSGAPRAGTLRLQKTMRESMQVTPCAGDLRLLVRLPAHADANEWIALNTIHFYRASRMIYDSYKCLCTPQSCPSMSAGAVEYLWRDNGQYQCPTRLPASSYMSHALAEALAMIDDQSIFPIHEDQNFPPHFVQCVREMYKRLFRLFAHLYYVHYEQIKQMGSNRHLNSSFKHFILFALEFDLLSSATIAPLQQFIDHIMASNPAHAVPPSPHPRPAA